MHDRRPNPVRLAKDVDLSKADFDCVRCIGTGIIGTALVEKSDGIDEELEVPKICRCVTRNGGIKRDQMHEQVIRQLAEGVCAEQIADEVLAIPTNRREAAVSKLEEQILNKNTDPQLCAALEASIELIDRAAPKGEDNNG